MRTAQEWNRKWVRTHKCTCDVQEMIIESLYRQTDRQTDRQADTQTDRQTDRYM